MFLLLCTVVDDEKKRFGAQKGDFMLLKARHRRGQQAYGVLISPTFHTKRIKHSFGRHRESNDTIMTCKTGELLH